MIGRRWWAALAAVGLALAAGLAGAAGMPAAYDAIVVQPTGAPSRTEFDLTPALNRARAENKRLYVYMGANDCRYCRQYEAFLEQNAKELLPHFKAKYLVVDLRSSLSVPASQVYIRAGATSLPYAEFQRSIGDERGRHLIYPNVWLFDADLKPLMQMPSGAGTFQTVPDQIEILQLVQ